jgi:Rrf2 family protein
MNKINRKVEYALIALKHMRAKAPGELTTAKEVSALYGSPFDATARAMQVLAQKGVLKSEHGAHGGYQITRDLGRVSLYELIETILGPVEVAKCLHEAEGSCEIRETCNIVSPVHALNRRLVDFYKALAVGELLAGPYGQRQERPAAPPAARAAAGAALSAAAGVDEGLAPRAVPSAGSVAGSGAVEALRG